MGTCRAGNYLGQIRKDTCYIFYTFSVFTLVHYPTNKVSSFVLLDQNNERGKQKPLFLHITKSLTSVSSVISVTRLHVGFMEPSWLFKTELCMTSCMWFEVTIVVFVVDREKMVLDVKRNVILNLRKRN